MHSIAAEKEDLADHPINRTDNSCSEQNYNMKIRNNLKTYIEEIGEVTEIHREKPLWLSVELYATK